MPLPTKAFNADLEYGIGLKLDNGWFVDASFGKGSYSSNHNVKWDYGKPPNKMLESDTCETNVVDNLGNDRTAEVAHYLGLQHDGDGMAVIPYIGITDWLRVVSYVNSQASILKRE
jgi:hypothetical protein